MATTHVALRISKCELVDFFTSDYLWLQGLLLRAKSDYQLAVVYVHGVDSNFYRSHLPIFVFDYIKANGVSVFIVNNRGHDPINLLRDNKGNSILSGGNIERFEDCLLDIGGALDRLSGLGYKKFVLMAHSGGSQKVAYYLNKKTDARIVGAVFIAPPDDYKVFKKALGHKYKNTIKAAKLRIKTSLSDKPSDEFLHFKSARRILSLCEKDNFEARVFNLEQGFHEFGGINKKILIILAGNDEHVEDPRQLMLKLKEANRSATVKIIKNAKHSFIGYEENVAKEVNKWLQIGAR